MIMEKEMNVNETVLSVKGLKKKFGDLEVLRGLDLDVRNGEQIAIIGPSGCGKSTFLRCINCMEEQMAKNEARVKVTLVCSECKQRNYDTKKNKKNDPDRLEMNKFCRFCRKHTLHKESK